MCGLGGLFVADYFVVVGLDEEEHPPSEIWASVEREGHICDLVTFNAKDDPPPAEDGWVVATKQVRTDIGDGVRANLNFRGVFREDVYLCFRRGRGEPITDLVLVHEERGETPPPGYLPVRPLYPAPGSDPDQPFDLSQKQDDRQLVLYFSRATNKRPLRDVTVTRKEREGLSEEYSILEQGLNLRAFGKDSYIAVSRVPAVCFSAAPAVLQQYPPHQRAECPMPGGDVSLFCMPTGVNIAHHFGPPLPTFFSFCLTVTEEGQRMYGCCVTFYEPLEATGRDRDMDEYTVDLYTPKCMCLLSRWPFFDPFREFLVLLFTLSQGPNVVPLERRLFHLLFKTPMPSYGTTVRVSLESSLIDFTRPPLVDFPLIDTSMMPLFRCLDIDNILVLFKTLLLEHKVVMHSKHKSLLLPAAETICAILFPFKFQHVYIPVMPTGLAEYLQAPVPYLIGMPTQEIGQHPVNTEQVAIVDLDHNRVQVGAAIELPEFPAHEEDVLRRELQLCASIFEPEDADLQNTDLGGPDLAFAGGGLLDRGVHTADGKPFESRNVRSAFMRFFLSILRDYRCCLRLPFLTKDFEAISNPNQSELFSHQQFRQMHPPQSRQFVDRLMETQCFMRFVEERTFPSTRPWEFVFFDQCIDSGVHDPPKGGRNRILSVSEKTPETSECSYTYCGNFKLEEGLFCPDTDVDGTPPVVSLDTTDYVDEAGAPPTQRKPEHAVDAAQLLSEKLHSAWFLLYRSYIRRKSEISAHARCDVSTGTAAAVKQTRQERLAALKKKREDEDLRRTEVASKGLHASFEIINRMHEAEIRVNEVTMALTRVGSIKCYKSG
eukprot:COSAG01_NODE_2775_length_7095_cov_4.918811_6_plen_829_part_00